MNNANDSRFVVASSQRLATDAALEVLRAGGNAADAAIAASAVIAVLRPDLAGIGSDATVLVWRRVSGEVHALAAPQSAAGKAAPDEDDDAAGSAAEPASQAADTESHVPGLIDAWLELFRAEATLPLDISLRRAIDLARDGYEVAPDLAESTRLLQSRPEADASLLDAYLGEGARPLAPGDRLRLPELGDTLARIIEQGRDGVVANPTAEQSLAQMKRSLGIGDDDDAAPEWYEPAVTEVGGIRVYGSSSRDDGIVEAVAAQGGLVAASPANDADAGGRVIVADPELVVIVSQSPGSAWGNGRYDAATGIMQPQRDLSLSALGGIVALREEQLVVALAAPATATLRALSMTLNGADLNDALSTLGPTGFAVAEGDAGYVAFASGQG